MRKVERMLPKAVLLIVSAVAVLMLGWPAPARAEKVTIDQLNQLRADAGLGPLSGEMSNDIPILRKECEQGVEDSCAVLNSIIAQFAPSHPEVTPESQQPASLESEVKQDKVKEGS